MSPKDALKAGFNRLFADYRINWIYAGGPWCAGLGQDVEALPITPDIADQLAASPTAKMRNSLSYTRGGLDGLVLVEDGVPVSVSHVADPAHYDEDALRGQGLAVRLMQATTSAHLARGKSRVIAFIWWSNTPSLRALTKAGWRRIGLSVEVLVAGKWLALRLPLPA